MNDSAPGEKAAYVTNRTLGARSKLESIFTEELTNSGPGDYLIKADIKTESGSATGEVGLAIKPVGGGWSIKTVSGPVNSSGYTTVCGTVNIDWTGALEHAVLVVATSESTENLWVDDAAVIKKDKLPLVNSCEADHDDDGDVDGMDLQVFAEDFEVDKLEAFASEFGFASCLDPMP